MQFDSSRAQLKEPDFFLRFRVQEQGTPIKDLKLPADAPVIVFERRRERLAMLRRHLVYHHVAQGELAGEPYLVSF